ncbi:hypothetical protein JQX09_17760 [Sulfitobacter pseudonitzschiae]|uniref:Uncharacterized protein n=1 Tax=Pseudosulfitobacter pseudonitzschiae TaxID=1402135 RepID=A0A9Q2NWI1_9RHOB|nr:hypothetical protein [Pseudosulfitobacter pseudonitzschiae]MBM2293777.1 hypothetical protein [Pseudosulfitobacter pseudonitzschiae]MBM2298695.1 hypothetical protein [Pseudosulfitobacter pseudonitzschiae]MBM2303609.1 hypothetical protein [Pseudosulfitobacter pseudonitzschiae]MBM2313392.1 hypothetical protein [Pseudosulfitobacter pseudonitzschiae]MBM2318305.1 hypothetical protein [Pseudosulfitobacter pseudonitzschiae]
MVEATTLAYLAGVFDSDGYITINRSERKGVLYFGPQIGISGTRPQPHNLAASIWGGKVSRYEPKNPRHRAQYQWSRQGAAAIPIIEAVLPYLLIKEDHALLAIDLWENVQECNGDDPFPWFGPDYDPLSEREAMRGEMIDINQSRNRVGKKRAGRLLDGREWNGVPS